MTPEQLAALMAWVNHRITDAVENGGDHDKETVRSRRALYQEFGFEEAPSGYPVAPGTYPPTSGQEAVE